MRQSGGPSKGWPLLASVYSNVHIIKHTSARHAVTPCYMSFHVFILWQVGHKMLWGLEPRTSNECVTCESPPPRLHVQSRPASWKRRGAVWSTRWQRAECKVGHERSQRNVIKVLFYSVVQGPQDAAALTSNVLLRRRVGRTSALICNVRAWLWFVTRARCMPACFWMFSGERMSRLSLAVFVVLAGHKSAEVELWG